MDDNKNDILDNHYYGLVPPIICICALIFLAAFICLPDREYSENENRYLNKFPEVSTKAVFSGEWMDKFEDYICDQFPLRDDFIGIKTEFEKVTLHTEINNIYICDDNYYIEPYAQPINTNKIIKRFNGFSKSVNCDVALMLVPTAVSVYSDKLPAFAQTANQMDTLNEIYDNVNCDTIDVASLLADHSQDDNLYYHLDHHWTVKGAYYGYDAYCKWAGLKTNPYNSYKFVPVTDEFKGTIYSKINDYSADGDTMWAIPEDKSNLEVKYQDGTVKNSMYASSFLNKKDKYSFYLGDDTNSFIEINNKNASTNEKLVVVKDSYANSLIPYLSEYYSTIYVINPRYYRSMISQFVNTNDISKVLILFNMNTLDNESGIGMIF